MTETVETSTKRVVNPPELPAPTAWYSHAVCAGDFVFPSGQLGTDFVNGLAPAARPNPNRPYDEVAVKLQSRQIFRNLDTILTAAGSSLDGIVRVDQFNLGRHLAAPYIEVKDGEFLLKDRPASTLVPVDGLMIPGAEIEVDALAVLSRPGLTKTIANSDAINFNVGGGYSQTVTAGDFVFAAGSVASDHVGEGPYPGGLGTGLAPEARVNPNYWYGSEIKVQTRYTLEVKLAAMLAAAGCTLDDVVRAQVYMLDIPRNWAGFTEVWKDVFAKRPPAMTVYPVNGFGTWGGLVEISLIATRPKSNIPVETIHTSQAPMPIGPCPQAVKAGPYLFLSTLMAADDEGLAPEARVNPNYPWHSISAKKQMSHIVRSAEAICRAAGGDLNSIVKRYAMHTNAAEFAPSMEVWKEAFPVDPPASTTVVVAAPLVVPECTVALDLIGYVG